MSKKDKKIVNGNKVIYSNIPTFNKVELNFKDLVYEGLDKENEKGFKVIKNYRLYKAFFGQGHAPIYVVTPPEKYFPRGVQEVCVNQIDFDTFEEKYSIKDFQTTGFVLEGKGTKDPKTLGDILLQNRVYELKDMIPEETIKILLELNNSKIVENALNDFFHMNGEIDSRIYYVYRGLLINVPRVITKFQKYNSHTLHIDGGKTGKTTLSFKLCGKTFGSATGSRMLGYASGDRSFSGSLDGEHRGVTFDDVNTMNYPEDFLNAFPNLMEQGEARIGKGSQEILTRSSSPFLLTTNTSSIGDMGSIDLLLQFEEIIKKLGNAIRIGSRFGLILFGNDFKEVRDKEAKLSDKDLEINQILVNQIFEKYVSHLLVKCFEEVEIQKFLNTPIEELKEITRSNDTNQTTRTFWIQFAKGFRHINGTALKQALVDYVVESPGVCLTQEIDFKRFLELCQENLKQVVSLNLKSFSNICVIEENQKELAKKRFEVLPSYQQALLVGLYNYMEERGSEEEKIVPIELLQDFLDSRYGKYLFVSGLIQVLEKVRIPRVNVNLEDYGVKLIEKSGFALEVLSYKNMVNLVNLVTTSEIQEGEEP